MTEKDRAAARDRGERLDAYDETILLASPDKPFRRALFVVLMAVGLFAAGSFLYARAASEDAASAKSRARAATADRQRLSNELDGLIALEKDREAASKAERQRQLESNKRTAALLAQFLAQSDDPVLRKAARTFLASPQPEASRSTSPKPATSPQPSPQPAPRPAPKPTQGSSPSPKPSPSQTCLPKNSIISICKP